MNMYVHLMPATPAVAETDVPFNGAADGASAPDAHPRALGEPHRHRSRRRRDSPGSGGQLRADLGGPTLSAQADTVD
jgi:hypothetical protein